MDPAVRLTTNSVRLLKVGWRVALCVSACLVAFDHPAKAYTAEPSPWAVCGAASASNLGVLERSLSPVSGTSVSQGAQVTFSGLSSVPVTFSVASSPTLLSAPDIDSGSGVQQTSSTGESTYTFTSTKATATPGTVYWTASFSDAGLAGCIGQPATTNMTTVRTLTVVAVPTAPAAPQAPPAPTPPTASVTLLVGTVLRVQADGTTAVELECEGGNPCSGKVTLLVKQPVKKGAGAKVFRPTVIGSTTFSVVAERRMAVGVRLNPTGRRLLNAGHGHLGASLQIEQEASGAPQTTTVHLLEERSHRHKMRVH